MSDDLRTATAISSRIIYDGVFYPACLIDDEAIKLAYKIRIDIVSNRQVSTAIFHFIHATVLHDGDTLFFFMPGYIAAYDIALPKQGDDLVIDGVKLGAVFGQLFHSGLLEKYKIPPRYKRDPLFQRG